MKEIFEKDNQNYNLRCVFLIKRHNDRLVYCSTGTAPFIVPKILPVGCQDATSLKSFKEELKGEFLKTFLQIMQNSCSTCGVLLKISFQGPNKTRITSRPAHSESYIKIKINLNFYFHTSL